MEKKLVLTEAEQNVVAQHAKNIEQRAENVSWKDGAYRYAVENGYSEEEAHTLINETVTSTVDNYNASCKKASEGEIGEWIRNEMSNIIATHSMDRQQEIRYKIGVIQDIRKMNIELMGKEADGEVTDFLTEEEKELLNSAEFSDEICAKVDEKLATAIEESAIPLYATELFNSYVEKKADDENVCIPSVEFWNDNQFKYSYAAATCIARHNGELASIPDEVEDIELVLGVCQGIDVVNVESKVAKGELAVDQAYKVLKVVAGVALTIGVGFVLIKATQAAVTVGSAVAIVAYGTGLLGLLVGLAFGIGSISVMVKAINAWGEKGIKVVGKAADTTYAALKNGAKKLYNFTKDRLLPTAQNVVDEVKDFLSELIFRIRRSAQGRHHVAVDN